MISMEQEKADINQMSKKVHYTILTRPLPKGF